MTAVRELPFGADTPDEFLAAYANGSLTAAERGEIDEWLVGHPEWAGRLRAYGAIGGAVREAAVAAAAPELGSLAGLWAAIDTLTARPPNANCLTLGDTRPYPTVKEFDG